MLKHVLAKTVLNKLKKRDSWFLVDYSLNPYESCSFNCLYCYIRGSKYGSHLADHLSVKINAAELLERQLSLRARKKQYGFIALGSATDAYLPVERETRLTRRLLEVIHTYKFPVMISTKSTIITDDIELLQKIDRDALLPADLQKRIGRGCITAFSFSTLEESITRVLESGAPPPSERMKTMQQLQEAGLCTGVNNIPVLPHLSDGEKELEQMIIESKDHGAQFMLTGGLTLFGNSAGDSKTMVFAYIDAYHPHLSQQYREMFSGSSVQSRTYQNMLTKRAVTLCLKHHLRHTIAL